MSFSGTILKERNEQIVKYISELKTQRNELNFLIDKQQEEKFKLETEIRRITYKLSLLNKSAEETYGKIVESSGALLDSVQKTTEKLESSMDKKVGTESSYIVESKDFHIIV
ncbi:hypothetical protein FQR65_LT13488 [Abscondita terminalis]|nr:hypothetical protein FQR65_LT13488 [Abscondita terminalis]